MSGTIDTEEKLVLTLVDDVRVYPFAESEGAFLFIDDSAACPTATKLVRLPNEITVDAKFRSMMGQAINATNALVAAGSSTYLVPATFAFNAYGNLESSMPYFKNGNIRTYLKDKPAEEKWRVVLECAKALDEVHGDLGAHGNISPDNFMVTDGLGVVITDFRINSTLRAVICEAVGRDYFPGSWRYKAYEELPREEDSPAVPTMGGDVAAFGNVMYEILTGIPPYYPHNHGRRISMDLEELDLMQRCDLADDIWKLLSDCWSPHNPSSRPAMDEVITRLQEVQTDHN
ncbi:hypothetical protein JAAARDRAFT_57894 [Jaapia argillacea MUCL 33604]|uniref:Protein kinase domain-containing protein n=1 Tax=Jaapia argillacea MUCL 33604 TaxID=933084 RepID=A0A067PW84_9AGAM|nr:hypothetical protein JAAARDRAFT_57894 [Jaapia argillacea MUCL 33604]